MITTRQNSTGEWYATLTYTRGGRRVTHMAGPYPSEGLAKAQLAFPDLVPADPTPESFVRGVQAWIGVGI